MFKTKHKLHQVHTVFNENRQKRNIRTIDIRKEHEISIEYLLRSSIWERKENYLFWLNERPVAIIALIAFRRPDSFPSIEDFYPNSQKPLYIVYSSIYPTVLNPVTSYREKAILCKHDFPLIFSSLQNVQNYLTKDDYMSFQWRHWLYV